MKGCKYVNDMAESQLMKNIGKGHMTAIIFWLKNHKKEYMESHRYEYLYKLEVEPVLTEERKAAIANAVRNWSSVSLSDTCLDDYEIPWEDESRGGKAKSDDSKI